MPLPETIPVRYTEEEAESVSVRPVVRQTFRLPELIDMIVSVTGKDPARIRQILRAGTIVYHFYRYWWSGFDDDDDLAALLAHYPDSDPARTFHVEDCASILITSGEEPPRVSIELPRELAARRRLLRRRTFWDSLVSLAAASPPAYLTYSYPRRADLFLRPLSPRDVSTLARDAARRAPRSLRARLRQLPCAARILYVCPRPRATFP